MRLDSGLKLRSLSRHNICTCRARMYNGFVPPLRRRLDSRLKLLLLNKHNICTCRARMYNAFVPLLRWRLGAKSQQIWQVAWLGILRIDGSLNNEGRLFLHRANSKRPGIRRLVCECRRVQAVVQ